MLGVFPKSEHGATYTLKTNVAASPRSLITRAEYRISQRHSLNDFVKMKVMDCPFCNPSRPVICSNESAIAIRDAFPVAEGHTLVIPKDHEPDITKVSSVVYQDCFELVRVVADNLIEELSPAGINIGVNIGEAAGQTIDHAHIHVIPRYDGDTPNPRGGVRGVIPGKADY